MQRFIQKLQDYAAKRQAENQEEYTFTRIKELEQILKYYDVPYKVVNKSGISLILDK